MKLIVLYYISSKYISKKFVVILRLWNFKLFRILQKQEKVMIIKHDLSKIPTSVQKVRISFALKIAIGQLNELVSQIGKHQITGRKTGRRMTGQ